MKSLTKLICFLLLFTLNGCSTVNSKTIKTKRVKCKISLNNEFQKKEQNRYHSLFVAFNRGNTERIFITFGTSEFEVNLPTDEYKGDNNYWWFYKVYDSITLEGVHNGLYWKQVKFYKDLKPSIGYDGIPKEKVPEFENYLNSFSCKKR